MKNHFQSVPIETQRLILRPLKNIDFKDLCLLDMDPVVRSFFPEGPLDIEQVHDELERHIAEWQRLGFGIFAAILKYNNKFIGRCGFAKLDSGEVEMGYLFLKEYWSQGYATETAIALLQWAEKNVSAKRIIGFAPISHSASIKVLEKSGMEFFKTDFYHDIQCNYYQKLLQK